ncbi:hypothetical protein [Methylobacterium sp. UNCCL125]|nr:hypothetical protein [Methylobacterium sp. UNCCL125]
MISRGAGAMGDDGENATFEILKGIQASLADLRSETVTRFDRLEARIDRLNAAGMRVTMRATAVRFDARVSEVEDRVAAQESRTDRGSSAERMACAASEIDRKQGTRQSETIQPS